MRWEEFGEVGGVVGEVGGAGIGRWEGRDREVEGVVGEVESGERLDFLVRWSGKGTTCTTV